MSAPRSFEKCFDRPFGGTSKDRHLSHVFPQIVVVIVAAVMKLLFRYRVDNRESLNAFAQKSGVVIVANHASFFDVIFLYLAVWPKLWPRFIARDALLLEKPWIFGWFLAQLGVFPIKRNAADRTAIKRATTMLKNKEIVCIFPEGTRRNKGTQPPRINGGAAFIARRGKAPILPVAVRNTDTIKQTGKFIRFPKITVEYGNPLLVSDFDFLPKADRLDGCIWYAMRECFALKQRCKAEEVDMKALFPDDKDFTAVFAEHPLPCHTSKELTMECEAAEERNVT